MSNVTSFSKSYSQEPLRVRGNGTWLQRQQEKRRHISPLVYFFLGKYRIWLEMVIWIYEYFHALILKAPNELVGTDLINASFKHHETKEPFVISYEFFFIHSSFSQSIGQSICGVCIQPINNSAYAGFKYPEVKGLSLVFKSNGRRMQSEKTIRTNPS